MGSTVSRTCFMDLNWQWHGLNKARLSRLCFDNSILIDIHQQVQDEWDIPGWLRDVQVFDVQFVVYFSFDTSLAGQGIKNELLVA